MKQNLYSNTHNALLPAKFTYPVLPFHATKSRILSASHGSIRPTNSSIFRQKKKGKKGKKKKKAADRVDGTNDVIVRPVSKPADSYTRSPYLRRVVDRIHPVQSNPRGGVSISFSSHKIARHRASLPASPRKRDGKKKYGGKWSRTANEKRKRDEFRREFRS